MMFLLLGWTLAFAEECVPAEIAAPTVSVAWISPLPRRVRGGREVEVVPTRDLTTWLRDHPEATPGDLLRHLGIRDRPREPRRTWKVTIFDVHTANLCKHPENEGAYVSTWRELAQRGFCVLPVERFLAEGAR